MNTRNTPQGVGGNHQSSASYIDELLFFSSCMMILQVEIGFRCIHMWSTYVHTTWWSTIHRQLPFLCFFWRETAHATVHSDDYWLFQLHLVSGFSAPHNLDYTRHVHFFVQLFRVSLLSTKQAHRGNSTVTMGVQNVYARKTRSSSTFILVALCFALFTVSLGFDTLDYTN